MRWYDANADGMHPDRVLDELINVATASA